MTPQQTVDYLNELLAIDPAAITSLVELRVTIDKKIEDHPTAVPAEGPHGSYMLGLLGVINGMVGPAERVTAVFNDAGQIINFRLQL